MSDPAFYEGNRAAEGEYEYDEAAPIHSHAILVPAILGALGPSAGRSLLDVGCGNGALTERMADAGFKATGLESSASGVAVASDAYPAIDFVQHDVDDPLPDELRGRFDVVVSAEVIEHLLLPRHLFARAAEAVKPGGRLVLTTPYHGYWKNLALALTNSFDHHWRPSWDYGHVKFFSQATLGAMATEMGWRPVAWHRVGRIPQLAKTMVLVAERTLVG